MGTIEELKTELETKTEYRFEIKDGFFGKELSLIGLNKKSKVTVTLQHNSKTGDLFYSVNGDTKNPLPEGFGYPCGSLELLIAEIDYATRNPDYGYKRIVVNKQVSLFDGGLK